MSDFKVDRTGWPAGPWDNEPADIEHFEAHGLKCFIRRSGGDAWCGYVSVPVGHPAHGDGGSSFDVHGGVTFARTDEDGSYRIGFDCGHYFDIRPGYRFGPAHPESVYRTQAYARAETERLAAQVAVYTTPLSEARAEIETLRRERDEARAALVRHQTEPDQSDPDGWIRRSSLNAWFDRAKSAEARAERLAGAIRRGIAAFDDGTLTGEQRAASDEMFAALSDAPAPVATPDARDARDDAFTQSFDAQDWARAFIRTIRKHPDVPTDEGAMIGWFANAIMRGYDEHARRIATPVATPDARDAEIERLRARVAALEAALAQLSERTPDAIPDYGDEELYGEALTIALAESDVYRLGQIARVALSGGTSALDARLATERADAAKQALDDVAARVGALPRYGSRTTRGYVERRSDGDMLVRDDVDAAIDAARRGTR